MAPPAAGRPDKPPRPPWPFTTTELVGALAPAKPLLPAAMLLEKTQLKAEKPASWSTKTAPPLVLSPSTRFRLIKVRLPPGSTVNRRTPLVEPGLAIVT